MFSRTLIASLLALVLCAGAQTPPAGEVDAGALALAAYEKGERTPERIATLLPLLADPARRGAVRTRLTDPLPVSELVDLLNHSTLAVRLGALELLEERAGSDFGLNPWNAPDLPENAGPLARWKQWLEKDSGKKREGTAGALLGDDQRRGYLRDLLGQDNDKASRARHMLETDGLASVSFLEDFLTANPSLPAGARAMVRQAQYQVVLGPRLGPGSAEASRNLAFGSRDQLLAALATAKGAGPLSIPILRDFITHSDPLVRETAIDSILVIGGADALPFVTPVLEKEPDVNVIHGALRRLKDIPGEGSGKLAASFLGHSDEDLMVSAIQTCLKLNGGDGNSGYFSASRGKVSTANGEDAIIQALSDPRWRVRVAALEYMAARKVTKSSDEVLKLLDDPDEFVRFASIKAAAALGLKAALPKLKQVFMTDEGMTGPVLEGYAALHTSPDQEMLDKLAKGGTEARIAAVRAAETNKALVSLVTRLASDPDLDVSCAALRFLSADSERVGSKNINALLVEALRSGSPEKRAAVLERLELPKSESLDPAVTRLLGSLPERGETTTLDPLYDGFLKPLESTAPPANQPGSATPPPATRGDLVLELAKLAEASSSADDPYTAALALARAGQPNGLKVLLRLLPGLTTARKAAIAEGLGEPANREALPLLEALMRDPIGEIRQAAAQCSLSNENAPAFVELVLNELSRPGSLLQPHETYSYAFESAIESDSCGPALRAWSLKTLLDPKATTPLKVLACIGLRNQAPTSSSPVLSGFVKGSSDPLLRRAAAYTLGCARPAEWKQLVEAVSKDESPLVREAVPAVSNRAYGRWEHRFNDVQQAADSSYYYDNSSRTAKKPDPAILTALERLGAPSEVSPVVRFDALFALMAAGKPVDVNAMVQLLPQQPEDARVPYRLARWFELSAKQAGPGLRPLFLAVDTSKISPDNLEVLIKRLNPEGTGPKAPVSFAALGSQAADTNATQQVATAPEEPVKIDRTSLPIVFFFKPGCRECARSRELMDAMKREHPTLTIEEHNILEADAVVLNQALCERLQVPSLKHNIAPSIFTQGGFLIREEIEAPALAALLGKTAGIDQDDFWKSIGTAQIETAKEHVSQRYQSLTLPVVIGAGLLDGVNPCAFATIIFFLSYLQIARRSKGEMLATGAAFILGVFLAYLAAGLLLHQVLATLHDRFAGIQNWLNPVFALLALVAAGLSFRDAMRARRGQMDEMTLQLPGFLKDRIRGVIRSGARARRFVIAAFLTGIAISFLELACTGQVYAPIVYQIQQGKLDAVAMLVIYNLAFIAPLVVIFLLAYGGLRSETLIALQKKHTFAVKIALGLLFIVLAAFILFGERLLHH